LVKDNIENPNDISGIVYITLDDNNSWQFSVAKELKICDYCIDLNNLM